MKKQKIQKFISGLMVTALIFAATGCFRTKEAPASTALTAPIELTYYKLFDNSDVIEPLIQAYQAERPNIKINYRKFTDTEEYYNLILNELAEGEGPDIFSVPNTWFAKNYKKVSPLPGDMMTPELFEEMYVAVTYDDLVRPDPVTGVNTIYGFPMTVDTLALYYNKDHFEDAIPERGKPSATWDGIKEDVYKLTKKDNSFERFEVSGMAMGFANNISRAVDILYLLIIQQNGNFYDEGYIKSVFAASQGITSDGLTASIGASALELYTSFANSTNKNYSWNAYLSNENTSSKEITTFARGKVSMIIGYSYMYEQIVEEIQELEAKGLSAIDANSIRIATIPQMVDPEVSTDKRDAYAHYFVETVARTSENSRWAWDFLSFMTSQESLAHYNEKTHKPTPRRDMIEDQKDDPIYGVFAEQIGFAESLPIYDEAFYEEVMMKAINSVLATKSPADAMKIAQDEINAILPSEGLMPQVTVTDNEEAS